MCAVCVCVCARVCVCRLQPDEKGEREGASPIRTYRQAGLGRRQASRAPARPSLLAQDTARLQGCRVGLFETKNNKYGVFLRLATKFLRIY